MRGAISWLPRAAGALVVSIAAWLAWLKGGGADARAPVPHAPVSAAAPGAGAAQGRDVYEVRTRLVEALANASIDVPSLAASQPYFQSHWRKLRGPWVRPSGLAGRLVTTIALRTNPQAETQWAISTQTGVAWAPNVRVWNMNEGTFDQRESIYAPTPSELRFRLTVPPRARLRLSPAIAAPAQATTVFDIDLVDASGLEHALHRTRVGPGDDRRWFDVDVDLGPFARQSVELRLRTSTDVPSDAERRAASRATDETIGVDGGVARAAASPMSLALWGDPVVVARQAPHCPYNVLWIVVDALRPDVAASLHDAREDAAKRAAPRPPLDALLPAVPGLMPSTDRLAARGVHFTHAWSAAAWTRPGTLAMLTGERSSELGIDTTNWVEPPERTAHYYASDPPLVPRLLRKNGFSTAAFVNNFFMAGYAVVGLDMGFERVTDHRYRTRDTALITYDVLGWLDAHAGDRFFLFVNYNSPHEPYDPPKEMLARVPPPPAGPRDPMVRAYMAEGAKDDVAIGVLLDKLDALGLTRSTLVVLTADHGETLSAAHDGAGIIGNDRIPQRFHHAVGNFEETTRIPMVFALPGVADGGRAVPERVRNVDIAPTVLDVEGLEPDPRMSGRSVLPLMRGAREPDPRVVVSEGRLSRAILWGKWRLIVHEPPPRAPAPAGAAPSATPPEDELFDLDDDPGERHDVARLHPDVVADLRARLKAALADVPAADARQPAPQALPVLHFRFAGGGAVRRISGTLTAGDDKRPATVTVDPAGVDPGALRVAGGRVEIALATSPADVVGFDLRVDPPGAPVRWQLYLDDAPWPDARTFVGAFGLPAAAAKTAVASDEARAEVLAPALPFIDPRRDLGVFVTRDESRDEAEAPPAGPAQGGEGAKVMQRVLEDWGYAHGSH